MTRIFLPCLLAALLWSFPVAAAESEKRPNIIFLMTDDQRWDNLGCYGRPEFKTHHIDRLAARGVTFDNAYYAVSTRRDRAARQHRGYL